MPACLILGDSLAAGVAMARPDCKADTKVGISSAAYVGGHLIAATTDVALLSLGVNDHEATLASAEHLIQLREGLTARRIYWVLPARPEMIREMIEQIARAYGDRLIETKGSTGPDGLHLTSSAYRAVARVFDLPP